MVANKECHPLLTWRPFLMRRTCLQFTRAIDIITQVILAFWLVLTYDLLEDRRIDDGNARFNFFKVFWILNLNQSQFFAKHSNQSVRLILYRHKITSVLFSCLSKWRNLKWKDIFSVYFNFFYYIKQIDSMLPCVCSVIDHRGRQNVVRTSVTHSAAPRVPLFCSYHILTSSVIYYWTDARQHGIYLLNGNGFSFERRYFKMFQLKMVGKVLFW